MNKQFTAMFFVYIASLIIVLNPIMRNAFTERFLGDKKEVLSIVRSVYFTSHLQFDIIKTRYNGKFFLEVYKSVDSSLHQVIDLSSQYETLFYLNDVASNIVVNNILNEGNFEILVPLTSKDLKTNIGLYRFDPVLKMFTLYRL